MRPSKPNSDSPSSSAKLTRLSTRWLKSRGSGKWLTNRHKIAKRSSEISTDVPNRSSFKKSRLTTKSQSVNTTCGLKNAEPFPRKETTTDTWNGLTITEVANTTLFSRLKSFAESLASPRPRCLDKEADAPEMGSAGSRKVDAGGPERKPESSSRKVLNKKLQSS